MREGVPRSERTKTAIEECFLKLWTEGENWVTRKEFFELVSKHLEFLKYDRITYRQFVRVLESTGRDEYFPEMRRRRKRPKRNVSVDS